MRSRRGFTLIELLIALNLSMLVINVMLYALSSLHYPSSQIDLRQNLNGIYQLRQKLALCRVKKVEKLKIACTFNHKEYNFQFEKNRLVMRPGYVVYLENIDQGSFKNLDNVIRIDFTTEGEKIHAVLGILE